MTIRTAIIGYGKIARDQHAPAIAADSRFQLVAVSTPSGDPGIGLPWFATTAELVEGMRGRLDAVAVCTPPIVRHTIAQQALEAGLDVLLEKPPAATLGEIEHLDSVARALGRTLYAAWHSQHGAAIPKAAELLAGAQIAALRICWFEDVRKWHPRQEWIWNPGGFGVFDPGINALSIATRILPMPLFVHEASLVFPANKQAPIAASVAFAGDALTAEMDWRYTKGEQWTIRVQTQAGAVLMLCDGGERLLIDGAEQALAPHDPYRSIYDRFAALVADRAIEVDREPLRIVADAFLVARREQAEPFH